MATLPSRSQTSWPNGDVGQPGTLQWVLKENTVNVTNEEEQLLETEPCKGISSEVCEKQDRFNSLSHYVKYYLKSNSVTLYTILSASGDIFLNHTHGKKKVTLLSYK